MLDHTSQLWLPPWYRERRRYQQSQPPIYSFAYLTWRAVTGKSVGIGRLRELAASLYAETALTLISTISIIQTNTPWHPNTLPAQQRELAHLLFSSDVARKVDELIASGKYGMFVEEKQCLLAAKLVILYGKPGLPQSQEDSSISFETLGELFLSINDILQAEEVVPEQVNELLTTVALQNIEMLRREQFRYLITRYYDLLATRSRSSTRPDKLDLDSAFHKHTALSIEEYISFGFIYLTRFYGHATFKELMDANYLNAVRMIEGQIRQPEIAERCKQLLSGERSDYIFEDMEGQLLSQSSFLLFNQKPLFRTCNGSALPITLRLLMEKIAVGAYWFLHDYFKKSDPKEGVRTFTKYVGQLFEEYITDLFTRIYQDPGPGEQHFYNEKALQASRKKPGKKADGIIVSGNSIVLLEICVTDLTAAVMATGDPMQFREEVKKKFIAEIAQLKETISGIADGKWIIPNIDRREIERVYPVLVLLHPFPQTGGTYEQLIAELPHDIYQFGREFLTTHVYNPQILTSEELEMLEPFLHKGELILCDLLQHKLSNRSTEFFSMKTFLLSYLQLQEQRNDYMHVLFTKLSEQIRPVLDTHIDFAPKVAE